MTLTSHWSLLHEQDGRTSVVETANIAAEPPADLDARLRLAAIVENSDVAIISKTLDGIVTSWNAAAETIFGYSAYEIIGKSIKVLIPLGRVNEERAILARWRRNRHLRAHCARVRKTQSTSYATNFLTNETIRSGLVREQNARLFANRP